MHDQPSRFPHLVKPFLTGEKDDKAPSILDEIDDDEPFIIQINPDIWRQLFPEEGEAE